MIIASLLLVNMASNEAVEARSALNTDFLSERRAYDLGLAGLSGRAGIRSHGILFWYSITLPKRYSFHATFSGLAAALRSGAIVVARGKSQISVPSIS
jgi:hypothetical protein